MITNLVRAQAHLLSPASVAVVGRQIWSAVAGAAVARVAMQICRHLDLDCPGALTATCFEDLQHPMSKSRDPELDGPYWPKSQRTVLGAPPKDAPQYPQGETPAEFTTCNG